MSAEAPVAAPVSSPIDRVRRAWRLGWQAAGRGIIEFYNSSNLTFASSIAYYTLLSIFPFIFLLLSILSKLAVGQGGGDAVAELVEHSLPSKFDFLVTQIKELARSTVQVSLLSSIVMFWASMGVFGAVTSAVNHAWGVEKPLGFFKHKLVAAVMLLTAGVILLITLVLVTTTEVVQAGWFAGVVERFPWLESFRGFVFRHSLTPSFILVVGLIYYFAPNAQVRLRDVWFGAILAGLLWRAAFAGFAWYLRGARLSVNGSVGAVIGFLVWVYLSAVILLYGVEVTAAYARLRKHLPQRAPAAPVRDPS